MEDIENNLLILTLPMKMKAGLIMIIKLVRKYSQQTTVSFSKQSPGIRKSHGQLHQSIQMEQSQFNAETNPKGLISGE